MSGIISFIIVIFVASSIILTLAMCKAASKSKVYREYEETEKAPGYTCKYKSIKNDLSINKL